MKWLAAVLIAAVGLCGCKSSQTSFNTLAPFGASRVPPPSTTVGATGAYYNRTAPPAAATPVQPSPTVAPAVAPAAGATGGQKTSSFNSGSPTPGISTTTATLQASSVQPASHTAGTAAAAQAASPTGSASSQLRLAGMPVNDATGNSTGAAEPAKFAPSGTTVEISQLPRPATPAPAAATPAAGGTVVASAQASDQSAPATGSGASTLLWKSRP